MDGAWNYKNMDVLEQAFCHIFKLGGLSKNWFQETRNSLL